MAPTRKIEENVLQQDTIIRTPNSTYMVHKIIGAGRFSHVYIVSDVDTGNSVVIKALNDSGYSTISDRKLYLKELDFLNRLKSNQLRSRYIQLRDTVLLKSGIICLVMERLRSTLQAVLHNIGPLPMCMCRPIVRQIAQGLVGSKCLGIVHADLKPDNIMFNFGIGNNILVKIIDFGMAFDTKNVHTKYQKNIQAIPYRAPEVCFQGRLDHGLDMCALGCIMPEIVTGVKLFDVEEEELLNLQHDVMGQSDQQCCEDIGWFVDLVHKMLIVMPETRITAVDALAHPFLTIMHFIEYPSTVMTKKNITFMESCMLDI